MKACHFIVLLLLVIGALNLGLMGFFNFDLISAIFHGAAHVVARIIFALIGLAGVLGLIHLWRGCCCKCGPNCNCNKK
ncbi:MAG: DUF378 domain-containing protein [Verrucomicrobiota bacterium]|nr:DUF378 domain-containing protein [Verrucomicrobiota bacterium]